jgi:hypothetical protein
VYYNSRTCPYAVQLTRHSGRRVHDKDVTGIQLLTEAVEEAVPNAGRSCHHEPYAVARQSAQLGRLGRNEVLRD